MFRSLRPVALLLSLAIAGAASGQTFQGLDSPQQPKKKPAKKSSSSSKSAPSKTPTATPASATTPATTAPAAAPAKATAPAQQDLGLDLSKPAPAQQAPAQPMPMPPPPSKKGTAPTTTFEALDVTGRTADRQRLEAANASFNRGEYDKAALAAWELMNDPKMAPLQLESQYLLGKTLYRMGQYHAALGEFSQILARGKDTKFFGRSLEWLFFISHKTVNESVILDEVARYANADWPERYQDEFHYLLARYHFVRGRALDTVEQKAEAAKSFEDARKLALTIPPTSRFYAQASTSRASPGSVTGRCPWRSRP
jgi:tetratricopeptide (TPR) repeat protein